MFTPSILPCYKATHDPGYPPASDGLHSSRMAFTSGNVEGPPGKPPSPPRPKTPPPVAPTGHHELDGHRPPPPPTTPPQKPPKNKVVCVPEGESVDVQQPELDGGSGGAPKPAPPPPPPDPVRPPPSPTAHGLPDHSRLGELKYNAPGELSDAIAQPDGHQLSAECAPVSATDVSLGDTSTVFSLINACKMESPTLSQVEIHCPPWALVSGDEFKGHEPPPRPVTPPIKPPKVKCLAASLKGQVPHSQALKFGPGKAPQPVPPVPNPDPVSPPPRPGKHCKLGVCIGRQGCKSLNSADEPMVLPPQLLALVLKSTREVKGHEPPPPPPPSPPPSPPKTCKAEMTFDAELMYALKNAHFPLALLLDVVRRPPESSRPGSLCAYANEWNSMPPVAV